MNAAIMPTSEGTTTISNPAACCGMSGRTIALRTTSVINAIVQYAILRLVFRSGIIMLLTHFPTLLKIVMGFGDNKRTAVFRFVYFD